MAKAHHVSRAKALGHAAPSEHVLARGRLGDRTREKVARQPGVVQWLHAHERGQHAREHGGAHTAGDGLIRQLVFTPLVFSLEATLFWGLVQASWPFDGVCDQPVVTPVVHNIQIEDRKTSE